MTHTIYPPRKLSAHMCVVLFQEHARDDSRDEYPMFEEKGVLRVGSLLHYSIFDDSDAAREAIDRTILFVRNSMMHFRIERFDAFENRITRWNHATRSKRRENAHQRVENCIRLITREYPDKSSDQILTSFLEDLKILEGTI